jgi:membrane fusion protein (multidrug efflux system)
MLTKFSLDSLRQAPRFLVFIVLLLVVFATGEVRAQGNTPPPKVTIAAAYSEELIREATFIGRGEAAAKTDLVARVSGIVTEIVVEDGASVRAGDLILRIEPDSYKAAVAAQAAAVRRATANLDLSRIELARKTELLKRDAVPASEVDIAQANELVSEAELAAAQAALTEAELNLGRTEIRAPFDGRIGRIQVSLGALVSPSTGALATLVQQSPMYVTFSLSEPQLLSILQQQGKSIEDLVSSADAPNVFVRLPNGSLVDEPGKIVFLDNKINTSTGTISIRAEFENAQRLILDGGFVSVVIEALQPTLSILIPQNALQRDQRGDFVLVVTDRQLVEQRYVVPGPQEGIAIVVLEGLREGESVIVEGLQRVRPGVEVDAVLSGTSEGN